MPDKTETVQILIVEILGQIGDVSSIGALIAVLRGGQAVLSATASIALTRTGQHAVEPILASLVDIHDRDFQQVVSHIVNEIGAPAIPILLKSVYKGHDLERNQAGWLLGQMEELGLSSLLQALRHENKNVRYVAVRALGDGQSTGAVVDLIKCLGDDTKASSSGLRICDAAAKPLEQIGTPEALAALKDWQRNQGLRT